MEKTSKKAWLRASRETLGLRQQEVADAFGVRLFSVKRWERPGDQEPPADVVEWMEGLLEVQQSTVEQAVSAVVASVPLHGTAQITYYRTQEQFDEMGRDSGSVGMANANARLVAARLQSMGYAVGWSYPDDEDNLYHNG